MKTHFAEASNTLEDDELKFEITSFNHKKTGVRLRHFCATGKTEQLIHFYYPHTKNKNQKSFEEENLLRLAKIFFDIDSEKENHLSAISLPTAKDIKRIESLRFFLSKMNLTAEEIVNVLRINLLAPKLDIYFAIALRHTYWASNDSVVRETTEEMSHPLEDLNYAITSFNISQVKIHEWLPLLVAGAAGIKDSLPVKDALADPEFVRAAFGRESFDYCSINHDLYNIVIQHACNLGRVKWIDAAINTATVGEFIYLAGWDWRNIAPVFMRNIVDFLRNCPAEIKVLDSIPLNRGRPNAWVTFEKVTQAYSEISNVYADLNEVELYENHFSGLKDDYTFDNKNFLSEPRPAEHWLILWLLIHYSLSEAAHIYTTFLHHQTSLNLLAMYLFGEEEKEKIELDWWITLHQRNRN